MTITKSTLHFEQFMVGQSKAAAAMWKLTNIDSSIAQSAFSISKADLNALKVAMPEQVLSATQNNSQLFSITPVNRAQINGISSSPVLGEIPFTSSKVKSCIIEYCSAQRQCLLALKSVVEIDSTLAKSLFRLDPDTLTLLENYNSFELSLLSDRHAWFLNLNYSRHENVLKDTLDRGIHDITLLESSLLY
jgi:hypothetical protein